MNVSYDEARRTLIALLQLEEDRPVMIGTEELQPYDRQFLTVSCAALVMLQSICRQSNYGEHAAMECLDAMELDDIIRRICRRRS